MKQAGEKREKRGKERRKKRKEEKKRRDLFLVPILFLISFPVS
jgi:hypothetical protein